MSAKFRRKTTTSVEHIQQSESDVRFRIGPTRFSRPATYASQLAPDLVVDNSEARRRDSRYRRRRKENSIADETRLFANSIRKFSLLNEFHHGLIEARGPQLEIVSIDPIMHKLLGWPVDTHPRLRDLQALPTTVHDLLPPKFRDKHRKFLAKAAQEGELPSSLMHPLRNVQMVRLDGSLIAVDVCVGVVTKDVPMSSNECIYYALVSERAPPAAGAAGSPRAESPAGDGPAAGGPIPDSIASIAQALYGHNVGLSVARGVLPRPEDYAKATVLFLDVVDFTKTCMEMSCSEVALWMSSVHMAIEELIRQHAIRKIETRGDCYIVVSGGNSVEGDISGTQMQRILGFARDVAHTLFHRHNGTKVRFGVATGAMTVAYIATHRFAPTMVACGDTVNTAARMEQSGHPGLVHMTAEAACQLHKEGGPPAGAPPPLHLTSVKSKGSLLTAWCSTAVVAGGSSSRVWW